MSPSRPSSIIVACGYALFGGLFLVYEAATSLAGPINKGLIGDLISVFGSWSVADAEGVARLALYGFVVLGVAVTILTGYAFIGDRSAVIGLSVVGAVCVVVFVVTGVYGGIAAVIAVVTLILLWTPSARAYFAVRSGAEPLSLGAEPAVRPDSAMPSAMPISPAGGARPRSVAQALTISVISASAALAGAVGFISTMVSNRASTLDAIDKELSSSSNSELFASAGITPHLLYTVMIGVLLVVAVYSVIGLIAALLAPRTRAGRVILTLAAIGALILGVLLVLPLFPFSLPFVVTPVIVLVKANSAEAREWFRR